MNNYSEITDWIDNRLNRNSLLPSNRWFEIDNLNIYLRVTKRVINTPEFIATIDIASVTAISEEYMGQGRFTNLLSHIENTYPNICIYVESVLNEWFLNFLISRGYKLVDNTNLTPCVYQLNRNTNG